MSDEVPEHLRTHTTDRGFDHMPEIPSGYGGSVRVYESSNAEGPHIWVKVEESMRGGVPSTSFAHLKAEDAVKLAEQIMFLVANHYQNNY